MYQIKHTGLKHKNIFETRNAASILNNGGIPSRTYASNDYASHLITHCQSYDPVLSSLLASLPKDWETTVYEEHPRAQQ